MPVKAPLMTPAGGVGWVGRGNSEIEQKGPSCKHTAYVLVVRFPWQSILPTVSSNSLKEIASPYIWARLERSGVKPIRARFSRT